LASRWGQAYSYLIFSLWLYPDGSDASIREKGLVGNMRYEYA
jgi:hypothetical protein